MVAADLEVVVAVVLDSFVVTVQLLVVVVALEVDL